jgi:lysophospholipase L1-like esterase
VVGNAGGAGFTSRDHVVQLKYLLPQLPPLDLVIVMLGLTDVAHSLRFGEDYRLPAPVLEPEAEDRQLKHAFAIQPADRSQPWHRRTALWQVARRMRLRSRTRRTIAFQDGLARTLERNRRARRENPRRISQLPSLTDPLEEYRRNVRAMIGLIRKRQARPVLATHPAFWRAGMSPEEEALLWFGWTGEAVPHAHGYYTIDVLAEALSAFDRVLKDVCGEEGVEYVDLAAAIPRTTRNFYDDAHFTDAGARKVAEVLASYLRERAAEEPTAGHQ